MIISAIKTRSFTAPQDDILPVINQVVTNLGDGDVLCVASKIVAIDQGRTVPLDQYEKDKDRYIREEAELTLPREVVPGGAIMHTITQGNLAASAGIDRSNGNNYAILWPTDPSRYAEKLRSHLMSKFNLNKLGIVITDSRSQALRYGTTGYAIGGAGLKPFVEYINKDDLFGRPFGYQQSNVYDGLATAATVVMGEGSESTPLVLISELPDNIEFSDTDNFDQIKVSRQEDVFWPLLKDFK